LKIFFVLSFISVAPIVWSDETSKNQGYQGYWRFVKDDFSKRHPFYLSFMINKAMNTRLYLDDQVFIQYVKPQKLHKPAESLIKVREEMNGGWSFVRKNMDGLVEFEIVLEGQKWYYREGKMEYQLIKTTEKEVEEWEKQNK